MNGFAIIGWGSLIWDLENLTPHVRGDWAMAEGPVLPMEFTRISPKRKLGLVVCLDPRHGVGCRTHAIGSVRGSIAETVADLARRERAPDERIGAVCLATGHTNGSSGAIVDLVAEWCGRRGLTGAVWTDLPPNFAEHRGEEFSIPRALAYLATLTGDSLDEAVRYIENAPAATDTPLRRALAREDWWQAEARRLGLR
ncbi:MAG TPA: hypothetical protein VLA52_16705 [Thermohalobaculum sp.]|nr:hypothetical protein [Thermohalobaculum sp.]